MNFNEKLNELIFKYDVDKHCPNYRKYIKAIALAKDVYSSLKTREEEFLLLGIDETDVKAFCAAVGSKENFQIKYYNEVEVIQPDTNVLLISYYQKDEIIVKLLERDVNIISLYEYFEENGLEFNHNFYDVYNEQYWNHLQNKWAYEYGGIDVHRIYFYHRRRYELETNAEKKKLHLEKMIFDCVYAKDFLTMKENIDKYSLEFAEHAEKYTLFYQEIETLLEELKNALEARETKDCIVFWLDALEYGMDEMMPFLKGLDEKALVFDRAFTVTPYTTPTLITLLSRKLRIEDETYLIKQIGEKDSILINELKKRGYCFKYYGYYGLYSGSLLNSSLLSTHYYRTNFYPFTQLYWDVLTDMTEAAGDQNTFCILHELYQTHSPYASFGIKGAKYLKDYIKGLLKADDKQLLVELKKQQMESREYVDRQLAFWSNILPDEMYKIYMSDHGESIIGKFHTIMKVQQKNICPGVYNRLLCYADFILLVLQLLDNYAVDGNVLGNEYAVIQEMTWYSESKISNVVSNKEYWSRHSDRYLGFQGIVTREDMLICYENGLEYYQKHRNDYKMVTDSRLDYLRGLVSKKRPDYFHIDKFIYARILITAEQRRAERTGDLQLKKRAVIENIFDSIQSTEILALRGGGFHTLHLLMTLKESLRNKVKYIIDDDKDCVGGKLGIEVITLDEMLQKGVTIVLISSYQYLEDWEQELQPYDGIQIINIYRILEEYGLPCEMEVCFEKFIDEDFEYIKEYNQNEIDKSMEYIRSHDKLILYGTGKGCRGLLKLMNESEKEKLLYSDKKAAGKPYIFQGKNVIIPEELCSVYKDYNVLVTTNLYREGIQYEFERMGIDPSRVYYSRAEF